jgi:hypothetical protein
MVGVGVWCVQFFQRTQGSKTFGITEIAGACFQPPAPNRADLQPKKKIVKHENKCPLASVVMCLALLLDPRPI